MPRQAARDESFALDGATGRQWVRRSIRPDTFYQTGNVLTEHGIVSVYMQVDDRNDGDSYSRYDFVWGGRLHMRNDPRTRTERGLTIEAAKFARRIVAEHPILKARKA